MKTAAQILVSFSPMILAGVYPFVRIMRGGRASNAFWICWVLLIPSFFIVSFMIPVVVQAVAGNEAVRVVVWWVPDPRGLLFMPFIGWIYAGITVGLAMLAQWVLRWYR